MKQNKKGFTIIELVIVISVVAILAGVLIPVFSNIVKKANVSADQQAVRQMNTTLAISFDEEIEDIDDVRKVLKEAGFNAKNYIPLTTGTSFKWIKEENTIALVNDVENKVIYPEELKEVQLSELTCINLASVRPEDPNKLGEDKKMAEVKLGNNSGKLLKDGDLSFITDESTCHLFSFTTDHDLNGENKDDPELVAKREEYKDWVADFAIILNDDMKAGSAGICGQYRYRDWGLDFPWIAMELPEDATAGTTYFLMSQGFQGQFTITYETLLQACRTIDGTRDYFNCGTYNLSEENIGKSITVELRLYENNERNERGERTAKYILCSEITVEFSCVAE